MDELQPADPRQVGRYRITGRLGAGGMGCVYLGHSPSGRLVAVKVVRTELAQDPGFRRRFAREVSAARRVTGFFTAAVVDADPDSSTPWLATAYVPGMPLDEAVATHGPWPVDSVRALGAGLAEALEAIHAADLVHRDLKPSNILIAPDGPRVVDFGISLAAEDTALTRTGMIVGTPGFMAPEQLTGKPVTPATDVFALGAVLTYAATGTGPFGAGSAQALNFRIAYEEPDLAELPSSGLEIITRCLAKNPEQRPTVTALIEELALVPTEHHPPADVTSQTATWIPTPVARALPITVTTPAPMAPTSQPQPAPAPPPVTVKAPATPATPAATALPPARPRTALPFWIAIAALALAMVLPAMNGEAALTHLVDGSWPFALAAALSASTCATAVYMSRRSPAAPVPRWPRQLHTVTTTISTGLIVWMVTILNAEGQLDILGPGAYVYIFGCAVLIYSLFRFPAPTE
ncbi:serine/threonine-protein kinase [Streptomyces sp. NPDC058239]|uniref:serine/threonine-protein kinase n=1 Tax=unclassified Streptomyces TaxID=2593676 RepID=UPI00365DB97E